MSAYSESTRGARPRHTPGRGPRTVVGGSRASARGSRAATRGSRVAAGGSAGRAASRGATKASGIASWADAHRLVCIVVVGVVALVAALYAPAKALYSAQRTNAVLAERLDAATSSATQLQGEVD